ncbi:FecR family protein [Olleya sp. HaHaR_3_96]|uniref:FecR family protein n=1 Tax=Olleya sp. HaHaR_3_96 TaxID=2745560 RepID=UPI001C500236|nr:FecR family protein [Olleya sp. HaHaR_3_96]QXP59827.1 FecR family protein [Olleya sp. HaHaR_3_96]
MNKEALILKWLDNNLSPQELEAFQALEEYDAITKLSNYTKGFKAPEFNTEAALQATLSKIESKPVSKNNWLTPFLKIAAILVICFSAYYYTTTLDTTITTQYAEKTQIELPDNSKVNLNALSKITYNSKQWNANKRNIELEGEAFFKVKKGSTFNVITATGIVSVVGTQFNVKQRANYFEVTCFEGVVSVAINTKKTTLTAGDSFLIINGNQIKRLQTENQQPDWTHNVSRFISVPLSEVFAEFERQYNVKIEGNTIKKSTLFSGKFTHNDINIALQSITQPLQLQYKKVNKTIILTRE